jgi:S-adenosylhomocysteine hydrolase
MAKNGKELKPAVYEFLKELDQQTALAKLETIGIKIDKWNPEQEAYAKAYAEGT